MKGPHKINPYAHHRALDWSRVQASALRRHRSAAHQTVQIHGHSAQALPWTVAGRCSYCVRTQPTGRPNDSQSAAGTTWAEFERPGAAVAGVAAREDALTVGKPLSTAFIALKWCQYKLREAAWSHAGNTRWIPWTWHSLAMLNENG